jgi:hypothetical protein
VSESKLPTVWDLPPAEFQNQFIYSTAMNLRVQMDELIERIKFTRDNLESLRLFVDEFGEFLFSKAYEVHQIIPPDALANKQLEEARTMFLDDLDKILDGPPETFKESLEVLKEGIYDKLFIDSWLNKVANYKKVENLKQNPKEFVEQLWKREMGQDVNAHRQQLMNQVVEQAITIIQSQDVTKDTIEQLHDRISSLRPEINRLELQDLEERLRDNKEISPSVVKEIMSDWKLIGTSIKFNLVLLDEVQKLRIIEAAKNRTQVNTTLESIEKDLERHSLIPDLSVIKSKYTEIEKLIGGFPEMNVGQRYNLIVNKSLLHQELLKRRSPARSIGSASENSLLKALGYAPKPFQSLAVSKLIEDILGSDTLSQKSADLIRKEIYEAEFTGRLKAAGVAENEIENMKKLIATVKTFNKELEAHLVKLADEAVPLDKFDRFPKIKLSLQRRRFMAVRKQINMTLDALFKDNQELKKSLSLDPNRFEKERLSLINVKNLGMTDVDMGELFKKEIEKVVTAEVKFYEKWQARLAVDAIQGLEDPNEVLQEGVCQAKCLRVASLEQSHPDLTVDKIGGEKVTAADRFEQARYAKASKDLVSTAKDIRKLQEESLAVPVDVYHKYHYQNLEWVAVILEPGKTPLVDEIAEIIADLPTAGQTAEMLKKSNGVLQIGIGGKKWGHALHCRIDLQRKIFRFHDPNIGIFQITGLPDGQATKELAELWKDIIQTYYPDTNSVKIYQLT